MKIFSATSEWSLEDRVNSFMVSEEFKDCVVISSELKKHGDTDWVYILTYFNRKPSQ